MKIIEVLMMEDGDRIEEEVAKATIVVVEDAKTTMVEEETPRMDTEDLEMIPKAAICVMMEEIARQPGED